MYADQSGSGSRRRLPWLMGLYAKYVLPRFIDLAMQNRETSALRAEWLPRARGDVLEVGIGSGLNLPFYSPSHVRRVYGLDPSAELQRLARKRAQGEKTEIEFLLQSAEDPVPLPDASIDTVDHYVDPLFNRKRAEGASADEASSKGGWAPHLCRTWSCSRSFRRRLARPPHSDLETSRRRLSPQSQDRCPYRGGWISDRRSKDVLSSRAATDDVHVPRLRTTKVATGSICLFNRNGRRRTG